jgi:hypothetical protein
MRLQWAFYRGGEQAFIQITPDHEQYVVLSQLSDGHEHRRTVPTLIEAVLRQADDERELTWGGWTLVAFECRPHHTESPADGGTPAVLPAGLPPSLTPVL